MKPVPDKDLLDIGFRTRTYLEKDPDRFVILVDDLEWKRHGQVNQTYERYRRALDLCLQPAAQRRASVHFFVYMLEAYYFADPNAVNAALALNPPLTAPTDDVESISNPKAKLKLLCHGFNEIADGGKILDRLDVGRVLADPATCSSLRTLFAWCVRIIRRHPYWQPGANPTNMFRLNDGIRSWITGHQV